MTLIKIDRELLVEQLYSLRAVMTDEEGALVLAQKQLMEIVSLVQNAPVSEIKSNYPGSRVGKF